MHDKQIQLGLTFERTPKETAKARAILRAAWLLRQCGLQHTQREVANGTVYDHGDKPLATVDRRSQEAHLALLGHQYAQKTKAKWENMWYDEATRCPERKGCNHTWFIGVRVARASPT